MAVCKPGVPGTGWDDALRRADGHFLQSKAWQEVREELGSPTIHCASDKEWMWAAHSGVSRGFRYLYVPYGPTIIDSKKTAECLTELVAVGLQNRCVFVRFEPMASVDLFQMMEFGREVKQVQPKYTWILDIRDDVEHLRRNLSKGHRGSINAAERKGLTIRRSYDPSEMSILIGLLEKMALGSEFEPMGQAYYLTVAGVLMPRNAACLYIAEHEGVPVSAAFGFDWNGTRHYAHAASDPEARRLSPQAPVVWQMIVDAKAQGMHTFDFWGVLPRRKPGHPWDGFTQFKQSFGGRLLERAGTWEIPVKRRRHRLYRTLKFLQR